MPEEQINDVIWQIRSGNYEMLRPINKFDWESREIHLPGVEISALTIDSHDKTIVDLPLAKAELRKRFGVTVVGIRRQNSLMLNIDSHTILEKGDLIYVFGKHEQIQEFSKKIS